MKAESSKLRYLFNNMPALDHFQGQHSTEHCGIQNSEVLQWISQNFEALYFIFDMARSTRAIRYNPNTQKWYGCCTPIPCEVKMAESIQPRKPGRPPRATVDDIVAMLPGSPIYLADWSAACCAKFRIGGRTFSNLKVKAEQMGLIESIPCGVSLQCRRIPAELILPNSATVTPLPEPNSGSLATVANTEK